MKLSPEEHARVVEQAMRLVWSSLESHFSGSHQKTPEGMLFHRKTIKEYVELLALISRLA
jgi:hypothetical protein